MVAHSTYAFKARDSSGDVISGTMMAASPQEVGSRLRAEGKFVFSVEDNRRLRHSVELDPAQIQRNEAAKRVRREDVIGFCQQMSVMLEAGVPLAEALDAYCRQTSQREFGMVLATLRDEVCGGQPFSDSLAKWPRVFPGMMVSLMKAAEASGTLSMMLGRVGGYLAGERRTARQIRGALSYPVFMMAIALVMTLFLMAFVLPRFAASYSMREAALPGPTRVLLAMSEFLTTQYAWYLPAAAVAALGLWYWQRRPSGKRVADWLRLNLPVVGMMYRQLYITRAARTMGTLLAAGVSLLDIIEICRGVTNNTYYDEMWDEMARTVRDGGQLSDVLMYSRHIPPNVASMIASGERSGRLVEVMEKIAAFSEEELDAAVKQATSFIEPAMIVFMGLLVGGVAMALLLPVFSMGRVLSGG